MYVSGASILVFVCCTWKVSEISQRVAWQIAPSSNFPAWSGKQGSPPHLTFDFPEHLAILPFFLRLFVPASTSNNHSASLYHHLIYIYAHLLMPAVVRQKQALTIVTAFRPVKNRQPAVIAGIARPEIKRQSSPDFDAKSQVSYALIWPALSCRGLAISSCRVEFLCVLDILTYDSKLTSRLQASENNDYCSACGGTGFLLCCDGCDRSFHFTCLDPPQHQEAILDEPWFCYMCQSRAANGSFAHGLFSELQRHIAGKNPSSFKLPLDIRDYFEGVKTGEQGEYAESQTQRAAYVSSSSG